MSDKKQNVAWGNQATFQGEQKIGWAMNSNSCALFGYDTSKPDCLQVKLYFMLESIAHYFAREADKAIDSESDFNYWYSTACDVLSVINRLESGYE